MRNARLASLVLGLLLAACGVRQKMPLAFVGDPAPALPHITESAQKRGYQFRHAEGKYAKFRFDDATWVQYVYQRKNQSLTMVVVVDDEKVAPDEREARFEAAKKVGMEIWAEASAVAKERLAEQARLEAEAKAKADAQAEERARIKAEARAKAEAEAEVRANQQPPAQSNTALQEMMDRTRRGAAAARHASNPSAPSGSSSSSGSSARCCINGAYYSCPDAASVDKCAGALARCVMRCDMSDMDCPEKCTRTHPADPSGCSREPGNDSQCKR